MGSSSDLEIVANGSPVPARAPSPVKPRVSGRTRRAPRGKNELAAPAAPAAASKRTSRVRSRSADPTRPSPDAPIASTSNGPQAHPPTTIPASSSAPTLSVKPKSARDASVSSAPVPRRPSAEPSKSTRPPPPPSSSSKSSLRRSATPKTTAPPQPTRKPYVKPPGGNSSDEADDFFNRAKPVAAATARIPNPSTTGRGRVPAAASGAGGAAGAAGTGAKGSGGGRVPKVIAKLHSSTAAKSSQSPPKPKQRKFVPSSSSAASGQDSDFDSSSLSSSPGPNNAASAAALYSSDVEQPMTKDLALPSWARGGGGRPGRNGSADDPNRHKGARARPGMSGADLAKLQKGYQPNRKRRRLSQESDDDDDNGGEDKGKGKGKARVMDLNDEGESDDSLELELDRSAARPGQDRLDSRPKRPGLKMSLESDEDDEGEDDHEKGRGPALRDRHAGHSSATPEASRTSMTPTLPSPAKKKMSAAQILLETARGLHVATSPGKDTSQRPVMSLTLGSSSDNEDDTHQLDPALLAIRSGFKRKSTYNDPDFEVVETRPVRSSGRTLLASTASNESLARGSSGAAENTITISLRMVFDPTIATASAMVKQAYEKEERFELGVGEAFSSLFDQLARKRYLDRNNLVITYNKHELFDFGTPKSLRLGQGPGSIAEMRGYTRDIWQKTQHLDKARKDQGGRTDESFPAHSGARPNHGATAADDDEEEDYSALERAASTARANSASHPPRASGAGAGAGGGPEVVSRLASAQPVDNNSSSHHHPLFRITVRGSKTQSIDLAVKPTTTLQSLIKAYAKHHHIVDSARVAKMFIEVEGDKVDSGETVQHLKDEFGLEDEETVDLRDPGA